MAEDFEVPKELAHVGADRIRTWRKWGIAAVKTELTYGGTGLGLRSGSDAVQQMAWQWIAYEEARATAPKISDLIEAKPGAFGFSLDIKQGYRLARKRFSQWRQGRDGDET